jgi:hypothetical protein
MLKTKIKQLFCKHEYRLIDTVRYHGGRQNGHTEFRAYCRKCGKPKTLRCVERSDTDEGVRKK